ncbi:hypothetical protein EJP77_07890 [Paenibacillus zeisoli]|uniref:DUF3450 domain-containing protein n=1 Tax=Paenibacillus zeisoli TaxID=2496267 RepID=A0A3S1D7F2_9BACL|nr:hypothetical protein [Paenibacillus zeisoli]RUT33556.1 hypothetical protein EJP77_07890 [Paenibacillus zeisoli]
MKKALAVLFSLALVFSFGTSAFADDSSNSNLDAIYELINQTNVQIEEKIKDGVDAADQLEAKYLADIRKLEVADKVSDLVKSQQVKATTSSSAAADRSQSADLNAKIQDETSKVDAQILVIKQDIDQVTTQLITPDVKDAGIAAVRIDQLEDKLNQRTGDYEELTRKYTEDLNKIITDVYDTTYELATYAINKAAEQGLILERYWKLVRFADKEVWIDPVWVVGIN